MRNGRMGCVTDFWHTLFTDLRPIKSIGKAESESEEQSLKQKTAKGFPSLFWGGLTPK